MKLWFRPDKTKKCRKPSELKSEAIVFGFSYAVSLDVGKIPVLEPDDISCINVTSRIYYFEIR